MCPKVYVLSLVNNWWPNRVMEVGGGAWLMKGKAYRVPRLFLSVSLLSGMNSFASHHHILPHPQVYQIRHSYLMLNITSIKISIILSVEMHQRSKPSINRSRILSLRLHSKSLKPGDKVYVSFRWFTSGIAVTEITNMGFYRGFL